MASSIPAVPATQTAGLVVAAATLNNHRDNLNYLLGVPRFRLRQTVAQAAFVTATFTNVVYDFEDEDSDNGHVGTSATYTVQTPGLWLLAATTPWAVNGTGRRIQKFQQNAVDIPGGQVEAVPPAATGGGVTWQTMLVRAVAGDALTVQAYQSSGGALSLLISTPSFAFFHGLWVSE